MAPTPAPSRLKFEPRADNMSICLNCGGRLYQHEITREGSWCRVRAKETHTGFFCDDCPHDGRCMDACHKHQPPVPPPPRRGYDPRTRTESGIPDYESMNVTKAEAVTHVHIPEAAQAEAPEASPSNSEPSSSDFSGGDSGGGGASGDY